MPDHHCHSHKPRSVLTDFRLHVSGNFKGSILLPLGTSSIVYVRLFLWELLNQVDGYLFLYCGTLWCYHWLRNPFHWPNSWFLPVTPRQTQPAPLSKVLLLVWDSQPSVANPAFLWISKSILLSFRQDLCLPSPISVNRKDLLGTPYVQVLVQTLSFKAPPPCFANCRSPRSLPMWLSLRKCRYSDVRQTPISSLKRLISFIWYILPGPLSAST